MKKNLIKIVDIVGPYCGSYREGEQILNRLVGSWETNQEIAVSFSGVKMTSSSFFNAAFGVLVSKYPIDEIRSKLRFIYMSDKDKFLLNRTIRAALNQAVTPA